MIVFFLLSNIAIVILIYSSFKDLIKRGLSKYLLFLRSQSEAIRPRYMIACCFIILTCMYLVIASSLMWFVKLELCLILLFLPLIALRIYQSYLMTKNRQCIGLLINGLARWLSIKQDIIYCFDQLSKESYLGPYQILLTQFNQHIKNGMSTENAFKLIMVNIKDPFLRMTFTNLIFSLQNRGDLKLLMITLEKEYVVLEEELSLRRIRLRKERLYLYFSIIGVGIFMFYNMTTVMTSKTFIMNHWQGQIFLLVMTTVFLLNTVIGLTLDDRKY